MSKLKVLAVEDDRLISELFYKPLALLPDVDLDAAFSEAEALERIRCRSYDVAFVDISLVDDDRDQGGLNVIRELNSLNEGTSIVVVSATTNIRNAVASFRNGIEDFLNKGDLSTGKKQVRDMLLQIAQKRAFVKQSPFGKCGSLVSFLAAPEFTPIWEHRWMTHLATSIELFGTALNDAMVDRLPVLKLIGDQDFFSAPGASRACRGLLWSKEHGFPIMIALAFLDAELPGLPEQCAGELIYERSYRNLKASVWKVVDGLPRSRFVESVWDLTGTAQKSIPPLPAV